MGFGEKHLFVDDGHAFCDFSFRGPTRATLLTPKSATHWGFGGLRKTVLHVPEAIQRYARILFASPGLPGTLAPNPRNSRGRGQKHCARRRPREKSQALIGAYLRISAHICVYRRISAHIGAYLRISAHIGEYVRIRTNMHEYARIRTNT